MRLFCEPNIRKPIRFSMGDCMRKKIHNAPLIWNASSAACKRGDMRHLLPLYCLCFALLFPIRTAVADDVPRFDVAQSCRAGESIGIAANPFAACMQKEMEARDQLKAQWAQFPQDDKAKCVQLCNCGGVAGSYIELLTCLQMRSDSRMLLPKAAPFPTPGPSR